MRLSCLWYWCPGHSIVETSRGRRTIGDAHSHVAGINRDWLGEGSPWVSSALIEGAPLSTGIGGLPDGRPEGTIFDVDVAGLHLSTENSRLEVFGMSPAELLEAVEGGVEDFDSLSSDQIRQIEAYEQLQIEHRELRARLDGAVDVEKNQIEAALLRKEEEGRSLVES
mgnify:FL=1